MTLTSILARIEAIVEATLDAKHGRPLKVADSPFWLSQAAGNWHGQVFIDDDEDASPGDIFGDPGKEFEQIRLVLHLGWIAGRRQPSESPRWRLTRRRLTTRIERDATLNAIAGLHQIRFLGVAAGGGISRPLPESPQYLDIAIPFFLEYRELYGESDHEGTAQAGGSNTLTLSADALAFDDIYNGQLLRLVGGAGAGLSSVISDYSGATKVATVSPRWQPNFFAQSENFQVAPWTDCVGGTATRQNVASPVHSGNACLVTTITELGGLRQEIPCTPSANHTWTFYVEGLTCTEVSIRLENAVAAYGSAFFTTLNLLTGVLSNPNLGSAVALGNGWLVQMNLGLSKATLPVASTEIRASNQGGAVGRTFLVAQPQFEEGASLPRAGYTPTTTAAIKPPDATTTYAVQTAPEE